MLATILKSKKAIKTTFLIIETFTKLNKLKRTLNSLSTSNKNQEELLKKIEEMVSNLIGDKVNDKSFETSLEILCVS